MDISKLDSLFKTLPEDLIKGAAERKPGYWIKLLKALIKLARENGYEGYNKYLATYLGLKLNLE